MNIMRFENFSIANLISGAESGILKKQLDSCFFVRRLYMPKCPADEKELNQLLSEPALALIEMIKRLESIKPTGVA